ncbi:MAG: helix-turn-helix domain-containing protein [Bacteroidetes bacterium]|nr:MAG: helix-turn-helix domain-containing protein [Bacteroidota bacterium]
MNVICMDEPAFYELVETVVRRLSTEVNRKPDKWIGTEDCMKLLGISSKTTLQQIRNEGRIRFTQPQKKVILYDRDSIMTYLDKNARETF